MNSFLIISIIAMIIAFSILIDTYMEHPTESTFGERFVLDHFRLNTPFYNFHFKPITLFTLFGLISWICMLERLRDYFSKRSIIFKHSMFILSFILVFIFFFEVFQVFLFWAATYMVNLGKVSIDALHTDLSPSGLFVNFTAMTKFYTLILFIGLYGVYYFNGILK